jgi:hypothetical protein
MGFFRRTTVTLQCTSPPGGARRDAEKTASSLKKSCASVVCRARSCRRDTIPSCVAVMRGSAAADFGSAAALPNETSALNGEASALLTRGLAPFDKAAAELGRASMQGP